MTDRKSSRREYLLRVRYQNTLPAPPFEPKFLKLPDFSSKYTSATFMSTLVQEQPPTMEIDPELGMPLDLSRVPGVFEGDDSLLYAPEVPQELDARDKRLLKGIDGASATGAPVKDVAYLRRTQYISSELSLSNSKQQQRHKDAAKRQRDHEAKQRQLELEPARQVAAVDATFAAANAPLDTLVHPNKEMRHLKAVASYSILPDPYFSSLPFRNLKFTADPAPRGSAGERPSDADVKLEAALLVPNRSEALGEFMTYFLPEERADADAFYASNAKTAARRAKRTSDQLDQDEEDQDEEGDDDDDGLPQDKPYKYVRDYDTTEHSVADDYAIVFSASGVARYVQLGSRMNMRSRRMPTIGLGGRGGASKKREVYKLGLRKPSAGERDAMRKRQNRFGTIEQNQQWRHYEREQATEKHDATEEADAQEVEDENIAVGPTAELSDLSDDDLPDLKSIVNKAQNGAVAGSGDDDNDDDGDDDNDDDDEDSAEQDG